MQLTENFGFLADHDAELVKLGALAERYFRDDPPTALIKLRQFAELLSKLIAAHHALYVGERETFEDTLRRVTYERVVPREAADLFHAIRKYGNVAVHEAGGTHAEALSGLRFARQLGIWFHRTYGKTPNFKPGPFVPPPEPVDATAPLRAEIAALQRQLAVSSDATAAARREADEHARVRESVEQRLQREAEERSVWERLAHEIEAEKLSIAARLAALQAAAEQTPKSETLALIVRGETAATKIDIDEAETRALIDQQLQDRGWEADTQQLRHSEGGQPAKGRNMAIAEWPTANGPADLSSSITPWLVSSRRSGAERMCRRQ